MTPIEAAVPFLAAAGVAALASPVAARFALLVGAVDRPDERRVNRRPDIPLLGGLAVALGLFVGLAAGLLVTGDPLTYRGHLEGLFVGGALLISLGALDDRFALGPWPKLGMQVVAAAVAIYYGFRVDHLTDPVSRNVLWLSRPVMWFATTVWIVGITNALNLIDGLDGLATGVAAIIAATLTWICWQGGQPVGVVVGVAFVGALLGFLPFNFSPARMFLGDTGALFIGYVLALLALESYRKVSVLTFVVPILALAVPLMDTGLSILRRLRRRASILAADRLHMHHQLLESEGSQRSAVLSLYFLTACFCVIALSFTNLEGTAALLFLAMVAILTVRLLRNLGFFDPEAPGDREPHGRLRPGEER
jgi:UDP-GlcNAc:undecaprenyl-phosphate GlcNAc-1-phosphate transferase